MFQKVIKTGNSLALTIPSEFVKAITVKPGQEITAAFDIANGTLLFTFPESSQLSLLPKKN